MWIPAIQRRRIAFGLLLLLSLSLVADGSIRVIVNIESTPGRTAAKGRSALSYSVVNEHNETLFEGGDLAVFLGGSWCVAPSQHSSLVSPSPEKNKPTPEHATAQPLVMMQQEATNGTLPGLGNYEGIRIRWSCKLDEAKEGGNSHSNNNVPIITSFLNFESERAVIFDIEYPDGAQKTSLVAFNQSNGDTATLATFPSFVMTEETSSLTTNTNGIPNTTATATTTKKKSSLFPPTFPSALSWEGSFVQSVRGLSVGPRGGPTVFYNASDLELKHVVVASPFFDVFGGGTDKNTTGQKHHFNEFTAGSNKDWTGTIPSFSPGRSGRLTSIPAGSSQSILLYQGSKGGITSTIHEWGTVMQTTSAVGQSSTRTTNSNYKPTIKASSISNSTSMRLQESSSLKRSKLEDLTLERIGYQTDNGAMYCFCRQSNCSEILLEEKAYLESIGIPIGYLSFQGAGTSSGRGKAAPWCVEQWSADGGQDPDQYPLSLKDFQAALGVPLQLYAPYFCPNTTRYFQPYTPWKSVQSNPDLPGCSGFGFETASASDSKAFFEWFFTKGIENGGMVSFESDFLDHNANCVDDFVENPFHGADEFLEGMAGAGLELGVPIQWCYASPNVVLSSLNFPAVTNFRVSFDYCYGKSYEIGESSLLVWAVGASPSKDTLWTTENNRTEIPGCDWTVDHEEVAAELHVVLAIMTTGPVGISDAIGMTNATLLQRIIAKDGSLLQPSKPITAVDSSFLEEEDSKPNGFLYGTHGLGISWIFVSFQLRESYSVTTRDFWPPLQAATEQIVENFHFAAADVDDATSIRLVYRTFGSSHECIDGENAISSGCVTLVTLPEEDSKGGKSPSVFVAPPSSFEFPGSDLSPSVVTVWKECPTTGSSSSQSGGIFFLGELDKYVALSPKRFRSLDCSDDGGVSATLLGSVGEVVEITFLVPHSDTDAATWYEVVKQNITVSDPSGIERFAYRTSDLVRDDRSSVIVANQGAVNS